MNRYPYVIKHQSEDENYKFLCWQVEEGIIRKKMPVTDEYTSRLEYELQVIEEMGFVDYFLIIGDILNAAERMSIPRGPARGSAAGSLVAYLVNITTIDPIRFGLFFERFLNPERISMPDVDIDISAARRKEIFDYLKERYGEERVGHIISFGKMKPRAAVRKVAKAIEMKNHVEVGDIIAKSIPMSYDNIEDAVTNKEVLQEYALQYPELFEKASSVCGKPSHTSMHAAGAIITPTAITDYLPMYYGSKAKASKDASIVQWDMYDMEEAGFLKVDLLGLNTLDIMQRTVERIKERTGKTIDLEDINLEDRKALKIFDTGMTTGLFQLERKYVQQLCRRMHIRCFDDVVNMTAIIRPGTMDSGGTDIFINRKRGEEQVSYHHPSLKRALEPTYGVFVFQEQIMQAARDYAGFSLGEADLLRKAVGKKLADKMAEAKQLFIKKAQEKGRDIATTERIFEDIETAARYSFNKSHAVSYSKITLQAAWLKSHYPTEYMCELLNGEMGNGKDSKVEKYIDEAFLLGLTVRKPSVMTSDGVFKINKDGSIEFGLAFIRNVTLSTAKMIAQIRGKYKSFFDFMFCLPPKVNARCVTSLINAGAMDCFNIHRDKMLYAFEKMHPQIRKMRDQQKREADGVKLRIRYTYNSLKEEYENLDYSAVQTRNLEQLIEDEYYETQTYLTYSPLLPFSDIIEKYTNTDVADILDGFIPRSARKLTLVGVLQEFREHTITKPGQNQGKKMCFFEIVYNQRELSCVMFPDTYKKYENVEFLDNKVYILKGTRERSRSFIVEKIELLSNVK